MDHKFIILENKQLRARVSLKGGSVVDVSYKKQPVLRPYIGTEQNYDVLHARIFSFSPFS